MTMVQPQIGAYSASAQEFSLFQSLVFQKSGIHLPESKIALLNSRLSKRLKARGCTTFKEYYDLVLTRGEALELKMAINQITTNETFFFRENQHFKYLENEICQSQSPGALRIWSAACSTGEEPYSIALTLNKRCRGPWEVVASDINDEVVSHAKMGVYPKLAITKIPVEYRNAGCAIGIGDYKDRFRIVPKLRQTIKFHTFNLMESAAPFGKFDVIFLRNVMIYFDKATQQALVSRLHKALKPNGHLFIGHSESLHGLGVKFKMVKPAIYRME